jgi:putative oxygen-independent coproporphyrinogen III oxidase
VDFGVYVHIPFCARRCDYCAFATWTDRHHLMDRYAAACRAELAGAACSELPLATSVFFGGGTPSLLAAERLVSILDAVPRAAGCEVTVECNPDTVTAELLTAYATAGVNRLSFGVQSMVPHVLAGLGRTHDPASVLQAAGLAGECGFQSFNVDLIFGGAGESAADLERTLDEVLALSPQPPHVSAYALTVEPGTPLAADIARHPDDDDQADKYAMVDGRLRAAGLASYEISNWARPGHECRHNLLYWNQGDYRGIGCAAHSHQAGRRWWNVRTPERYIALVEAGESPLAGEEVLDVDTRRRERLELALRTAAGVPADAIPDDPDLDGLVWRFGGRAGLTVPGRLLANEVALRLR